MLGARAAMADLLGCDAGGVVFGRSMTQLTYDLARALAKTWEPGDEVVVTRLDHDANIRPWLTRRRGRSGRRVRWVDFDPETGELAVRPGRAVGADPPGRGHRRLQPARHPSRPRGRSPPPCTRPAPCCSSTACT